MNTTLQSNVPSGSLAEKWDQYRFDSKLVNPANRRKFSVIVVGSGLAGASAAATLAEQGYRVKVITYHDSPRRAHSIAAQGGINAAKNYQNDGDSVYRLFYDTVKGGDYRSREANVYRLAQVSVNIIDQCVAQGVPFARDYGGMLSNRSFGGAQVSRTFYARGQTGQQLLIGAYHALMRQVGLKAIDLQVRKEMLDLIVIDGKARGVVTRNLITGEVERHVADAVLLCTGGYSNAYYLSTSARMSNATAAFRSYKRGAAYANPCFVQIHPTCIPVAGDYQSKLTLMSESLRNDGRVWVPKAVGDKRPPNQIPDAERDYYLERIYPSFGNLAARDVSSRAAKRMCDEGRGVGASGLSVYLDFRDAINRVGENVVREKYGNLFDMYHHITDENPYKVPMRIFPAPHYTMGGLWVDYGLMSTVPGLFVLGEANYSDHGANRLGASALMQGLADGYFVISNTLANYLAGAKLSPVKPDDPAALDAENSVNESTKKLLSIRGTKTVDELHWKLGRVLWDHVGMGRTEAGLKKAIVEIRKLKQEFWSDLRVTGEGAAFNQELEKAGRVADYFDLGELIATDALQRDESCGAHFREEHQTEDGEAVRNDEKFAYVSGWFYQGEGKEPLLVKEDLKFENLKLATRSYK